MSTFTENYDFIKPSVEDPYDIQDFNENMDAIDALLAENETAMEQVNEKIGTPEDTGNNTVFGLLKNGGSLIKSIQHVTHTDTSSLIPISINPVDPEKCIVILERLQQSNEKFIEINYRLESSVLYAHIYASGYSAKAGFWIIEFY